MEHDILCLRHGTAAVVSADLIHPASCIAELFMSCGCSQYFPSGTESEAFCMVHSLSAVEVLVRQECENCGRHAWVLLACGCQGQFVVRFGRSFFSAQEAHRER
jgi:hypothetical protein